MTGTGLQIRVITHGNLRQDRSSGSIDDLAVAERGTTLAAVLTRLGIDCGLVGVISSEGRLLRPESVLEKECTVEVYPMFGGG